ncbi:MAG: hypothetical protein MPN21_19065 [Thermoanaerobaculia bacterium]|nr:hypothetical protein [Thermoanaerobaculia bacterium]
MFLHRIATASKRPNWTAICIEFGLVIFGVLTALQVNNWNASRIDKQGAANTLSRLRSEVLVNVAALDERMTILEESSDVRSAAMTALQTCDASPEAAELLGNAGGSLTGDIIPSFVDNTLLELARRDRYLDFLSNDFRAALNVYSGRLSDERDQLRINFGLMWDQHVVKHSSTGVDITKADFSTLRFVFSQPLDTLCEDSVFRRQFVMTEIWHQSAMLRMQRFKGWNEEFLAAIDAELDVFG